MNIRVILTTEQTQRAIAHVYGCGVADVHVEGTVDIQVDTDLEGGKRAERLTNKVPAGSVWTKE